MWFKIDPRIFENFSGVRIGVIVAKNIKNSTENKEVFEKLQEIQSQFNEVINKSLLDQHPFIKTWHEVYQKFGANSKKHLSSIENLGSRIVKGSIISPINTLVDLYNIISLKYMLPAGGENLDALKGDIQLTISGENEPAVTLLGQKEARSPKPGEVIYKDENGAICRRWNWKEAERSKITPETKNAIFVIEALPPVETELFEDAINELAYLIHQYCDGAVTKVILDEEKSEIRIRQAGEYLELEPIEALSDKDWAIYNRAFERKDRSEETQLRIEKVDEMRQAGIEPWPQAKPVPDTCKEVLNEFGTNEQRNEYAIAGRLMSLRLHGKTAFADVQDVACRLQIYIKQDILGKDKFQQLKKFVDLGDIIWVTGSAFRTKMGEITLEVTDFELLSKCLHPLPEKFHGLTDTETRYRQRYLDLISNPESKQKFIRRSLLIRSMRNFFDNHGFLEVETPMLHPIAGGAAARPFITHHNAFDTDFYLRIAPELYLKRLVVGGFERVYEINRNFRNEGISARHNPEFTMTEFYMAHQDYHFIMGFVENLLRTVIKESCGILQVPFGEHIIDFEKPFKRISIRDSVIEIGGLSQKDILESNIDETLKKHSVKLANKNASIAEKIYALFEEIVEAQLIQPTYVIDFPIEVSPLAKRDPDNPNIAARFELFIGGMELSNGFNELNDPFDQAERFKQQLEAHRAGDEEAHQYDADYIQALEYGLPPTVGVGIGIDRLVMLATNTTSIKDVILFPTLKRK
ncbi:MAG: lysine--tRNA ligase [Candidatus Babeliales bacterium]